MRYDGGQGDGRNMWEFRLFSAMHACSEAGSQTADRWEDENSNIVSLYSQSRFGPSEECVFRFSFLSLSSSRSIFTFLLQNRKGERENRLIASVRRLRTSYSSYICQQNLKYFRPFPPPCLRFDVGTHNTCSLARSQANSPPSLGRPKFRPDFRRSFRSFRG